MEQRQNRVTGKSWIRNWIQLRLTRRVNWFVQWILLENVWVKNIHETNNQKLIWKSIQGYPKNVCRFRVSIRKRRSSNDYQRTHGKERSWLNTL